MSDFFAKHRETLEKALVAAEERGYWAAYPESFKAYPEDGNKVGKDAFKAYLGKNFDLDQPGTIDWIGEEVSPFGLELNVKYPQADLGVLIPAMQAAKKSYAKAGPEAWAGVCLELLDRLNKRSYELGWAVHHTTGQGFMMAFQAGGPHAQDRGLEAVTYAYEELTQHARESLWEKPQGKHDPIRLKKVFTPVPRGIGLVVGCSTFPTWNGYPGLFADLATGNAVIMKPHPLAILPVAITVQIAREVLADAGFDPNVVTMVVDTPTAPVTKELALNPAIKLVDFTGSTQFGDWLEQNALQAKVYTEKAGVNTMVIDSVDNLKAFCMNMAFTLSLYSGQMCTTTQNIFVPRDGLTVDGEHMSFDDFTKAVAGGVDKFLSVPERAVEVLGAIQNPATVQRLKDAHGIGEVILASKEVPHERYDCVSHTPLLMKLDAADADKYSQELFGPIAFFIATDSTEHSLELAGNLVKEHGAITAGFYSTDEDKVNDAIETFTDAGVALSINLYGNIYVNQSAAFSDFHATGANPAANAALTDAAFVASRFCIVQHRQPA